MEPLTDLLKKFTICRGLSLSHLTALASNSQDLKAEKDAVLFQENEPSDYMVFLLDGALEVRGTSGHLFDIPPFHLVGEMGVVCKLPRSATVAATGRSRSSRLDQTKFENILYSDNDFAYIFFRNLTEMLAERLKGNNLLVEFYQSMK